MHILSGVDAKEGPMAASFIKDEVSEFEYHLLNNFLLSLYKKQLTIDELCITKWIGIENTNNPIPHFPNIIYNERFWSYEFKDHMMFISIEYKGGQYEICFQQLVVDAYSNDERLVNRIFLNGITPEAKRSKDLLELLLDLSVKQSNFLNQIVVYDSEVKGTFLSKLKIIRLEDITIDEIFLPEFQTNEIERLIYAVKNYDRDKINLRYLLSGPPGTGKTKLINSILGKLEGSITTLLTNGGEFEIESIFSFCNKFEKILLVIDDLDFITPDRTNSINNKSLGIFLQKLDGYLPNKLFLLASTNEKERIDLAAQRPMRFDVVLDLNKVDAKFYFDVINRETNDSEIIRLFSEEIILQMRQNRVSGAFIVSLIKQIKSLKLMTGNVTPKHFKEYFELIHRGFYKSNSESNRDLVGFGRSVF